MSIDLSARSKQSKDTQRQKDEAEQQREASRQRHARLASKLDPLLSITHAYLPGVCSGETARDNQAKVVKALTAAGAALVKEGVQPAIEAAVTEKDEVAIALALFRSAVSGDRARIKGDVGAIFEFSEDLFKQTWQAVRDMARGMCDGGFEAWARNSALIVEHSRSGRETGAGQGAAAVAPAQPAPGTITLNVLRSALVSRAQGFPDRRFDSWPEVPHLQLWCADRFQGRPFDAEVIDLLIAELVHKHRLTPEQAKHLPLAEGVLRLPLGQEGRTAQIVREVSGQGSVPQKGNEAGWYFGGRVQVEPASKTVNLDGARYSIESPEAFVMLYALVKAEGAKVRGNELQSERGCKGKKVSRVIENLPPELHGIIKSQDGNAGGYWITLPKMP